MPRMISQEQLDEASGYWKQPDLLTGADYFLRLYVAERSGFEIHNMKSGFYLINTKVGPIITGSGYTNMDNYGLCLGRLRTLIKRLQNNKSLLNRYNEII
ncbi:unnamed protein product [Acanthocheilonema viteae]|uniref:Uncharacterized protein n=1 Tax=Acanthocheilonema viteae TaxID=6277 RepID=A0A498S1S0_ACAVI|nr:unnamed protein product [Acanthocheilonema viteae]